ncbi:MAG: NAD(P)-dependent oxidoreductase [Flavobacteriales bacterium]
MKFLIIDTFHESLQQILEQEGHDCLDMSDRPMEEVIMALPFAEGILLRSRIAIRQELIDRSPNLKVIGRVGAGLEHIDVEYAQTMGIKVVSSPEGNRQAVAEHALAMLLAMFNRIPKADREVRKGVWLRKENEGIELQGKTVGIVGCGNTGSAFAKVISGFGVTALAYDKYIQCTIAKRP